MFSKKDRKKYDEEIETLKKNIKAIESQLEYFKFKENHPNGVYVTSDCGVNNTSNPMYYWSSTANLDYLFDYSVTATWADQRNYTVNTKCIIECKGRPLSVRRYSIDDGVISVAFSVHKIDGEYTVKFNTNSKTSKIFHNGVPLPYSPNTQDGKIIFHY